MNDTKLPQEAIDWMNARGWGPHHDEWHYTRRFDYWPHLAANHPDPAARAEFQRMVDFAQGQGWQRAALQEGVPGSGLDFFAMHRAMLILLVGAFPRLQHFFRGWETPPTDPADVEDPVADGVAFDEGKLRAITIIRSAATTFANDDELALYLETPVRPQPDNPTYRDPNAELEIHNYLHNRWTNTNSPVNLGDPKVNIFNTRFWKLHGWIDYQWWRFRQAKGLPDNEPSYARLLDHYLHMMGHPMHHRVAAAEDQARPAGFGRTFAF